MTDIQIESEEDQSAGPRSWLPLVAISLAMFSVVLDSTMMNVAVGAIARDLDTSVVGVQSAISLYSLVMASLMLTGGKLGDIRGAARIFQVGCAVFAIGSLLSAFSWNLGVLILGWSVIEGIGAAMILPMAMVLIFANYEGPQRAAAFGIWGGVQASGAAVGPILGGFLTSYLTWRLGFGMHVVIMSAALLSARSLREPERNPDARLDIVGTVISATGLALIVLGFLLAGKYGLIEARRQLVVGSTNVDLWGLSPTPFLIATGLIVLVGFAHWQQRLSQHGGTPLLRLHILANFGFMSSVTTDSLRQLALAGVLFIVPVFSQSALGFTAIQSGLAVLPFSVMVFMLSMTTAGLGERIAPKWLILGGLGGFGLGLVLLRAATSETMGLGDFVLPMGVMGLGLGLFVAQIVNLTISQVGGDERNEGAGTHNTFRELGGALGTAVIGAILLTGVFSGVSDGLLRAEGVSAPQEDRRQLAVALEDANEQVAPEDGDKAVEGLPAGEQAEFVSIVERAQVDAMKNALTWTAGFVLLAMLLATFLPGSRKQDKKPEPEPRALLK